MEPAEDPALPPLREDLTIAPGAPLLSGAPSWVIYDPIRHRFFQIGQRTIAMISHWSAGTIGALRQRLRAERALEVKPAEIEAVIGFLQNHNLTASSGPKTAKRLNMAAAQAKGSLWHWAAHKYVFFRVPLVRPQRFLQATWPIVAPLFTRGFVLLTLAVLALALYLTGRQWAHVQSHFSAAFTLSGAGAYAVAIVLVKILHELGHAYQAISRGLRVPVMGVAFLVMFPLLYTDVTDAWRLRNRRDRIMIDAAGVMTEMTIAIYATLMWCFLPDGALRSAAFAIATVSWFFSLLINLNPLMRFDGYYFLADALGVHNLQPRSFAFGRWAMRRALFGLPDAPPEPMSHRMTLFMIVYAYTVWVYRFFLFIGIALLVYALFFKALGVLLFVVEIIIFIVKPVLREFREWVSMRNRIMKRRRIWITLTVLAGLGLAAFWPMAGRIEAPAILEMSDQQLVFPTSPARLAELYVTEGDRVQKGDLIALFEDPELPRQIAQSKVRIEMLETRLLSGAGDDVERAERVVLTRQLEEERQLQIALQDRQENLKVTAQRSGRLVEVATDVASGAWIDRQRPLARIVGGSGYVVRGLIEDRDRTRLNLDGKAVFFADDVTLPALGLNPPQIADFAIEIMPDGYLAATSGGPIAVATRADGALVPRDVWYPLTAEITGDAPDSPALSTVAIPGAVILRTHPESWASRAGRQVARILIRESGL